MKEREWKGKKENIIEGKKGRSKQREREYKDILRDKKVLEENLPMEREWEKEHNREKRRERNTEKEHKDMLSKENVRRE